MGGASFGNVRCVLKPSSLDPRTPAAVVKESIRKVQFSHRMVLASKGFDPFLPLSLNAELHRHFVSAAGKVPAVGPQPPLLFIQDQCQCFFLLLTWKNHLIS
jgi:hypothetical protein